jgi:intracellular sulfur oxidation DsrE/DsrF family protein
MCIRIILAILLYLALGTVARADEEAPYPPGKVVYDVSSADPVVLERILDRASALQNLYGNDPFDASIVIVVHEGAVPFFADGKQNTRTDLIQRASSLALGGVVEFRLCRMSAAMQGFSRENFSEFITLVPMADAEIVQFQRAGFAYLN